MAHDRSLCFISTSFLLCFHCSKVKEKKRSEEKRTSNEDQGLLNVGHSKLEIINSQSGCEHPPSHTASAWCWVYGWASAPHTHTYAQVSSCEDLSTHSYLGTFCRASEQPQLLWSAQTQGSGSGELRWVGRGCHQGPVYAAAQVESSAQFAADQQVKVINHSGGVEVRTMRRLTTAAVPRQRKKKKRRK